MFVPMWININNSLHGFVSRPQGKPKPVVTWTKGGQPVDPKRVNVRSTERDSILFIRAAEREDSGVYDMSVKVEGFEDKASLTLQIVGEQRVDTAKQRLKM